MSNILDKFNSTFNTNTIYSLLTTCRSRGKFNLWTVYVNNI